MPKGIYKHKSTQGFQKGYEPTEKHKKNLGLIKKGNQYGIGNKSKLGKQDSDETKRKKREATIKRYQNYEERKKTGELVRGEKNGNWQGGISFEPYSLDWTETLRRSIRERDHYTCQLCGELQSDRAFDVHHKNYDKKDCNPNNLITFCHRCHMLKQEISKGRE